MIGTTHHCAAALICQRHPLLQLYHFKSHGYGPIMMFIGTGLGLDSCSKPIQKVWQEVMSQYKG